MKNTIALLFTLFAGSILFSSCEKSDPFVDRVVSPLLVLVETADGVPSSGLTTDPTVNASFASAASFRIRVLELDKTNILDYTKGIDSLPVATSLVVKFRNGAEIGSFTSDGTGLAKIEIPWETLGITASGKSVSLSVSGSYKEQAFTKYFKIASK